MIGDLDISINGLKINALNYFVTMTFNFIEMKKCQDRIIISIPASCLCWNVEIYRPI